MKKLKLLRLLFVAIILMSSHIYIQAEEYDVILSATAEKVDPILTLVRNAQLILLPQSLSTLTDTHSHGAASSHSVE